MHRYAPLPDSRYPLGFAFWVLLAGWLLLALSLPAQPQVVNIILPPVPAMVTVYGSNMVAQTNWLNDPEVYSPNIVINDERPNGAAFFKFSPTSTVQKPTGSFAVVITTNEPTDNLVSPYRILAKSECYTAKISYQTPPGQTWVVEWNNDFRGQRATHPGVIEGAKWEPVRTVSGSGVAIAPITKTRGWVFRMRKQ